MEENKPGYVTCCISGQSVKATPEEVQAVQVFAERLHQDFNYPKAHMQTHPQWRVRKSPSDKEKSYPVDIAVFHSSKRTEDDLYIVVECKRKNRKDGVEQLRIYLNQTAGSVV